MSEDIISKLPEDRLPIVGRTDSSDAANSDLTTQRVLRFIREFWVEHSYSPTIRDIMEGCYMSSTSVAHYHVRKLEVAGLIVREKYADEKGRKYSRGMMLPGGRYIAPPSVYGQNENVFSNEELLEIINETARALMYAWVRKPPSRIRRKSRYPRELPQIAKAVVRRHRKTLNLQGIEDEWLDEGESYADENYPEGED